MASIIIDYKHVINIQLIITIITILIVAIVMIYNCDEMIQYTCSAMIVKVSNNNIYISPCLLSRTM